MQITFCMRPLVVTVFFKFETERGRTLKKLKIAATIHL